MPGAQTDWKCADCNAVAAWAQVIPARDGTVTSGFPLESTTSTVEPSFCDTPGLGLCETTSPAATVMDVTGAPCFKVIWTLSTAALACASGRLTTVGVGCDGVNTFVAKAVTNPAARITANATAPPIHHHFLLFRGMYGSDGPPVLRIASRLRLRFDQPPAEADAPAPPPGSASKSSPGPALVPIGVAAAASPGAMAVPSPTAAPAATAAAAAAAPAPIPESVSSLTPGARKPAMGAESSSLGVIRGRAEGVGRAEASAPSRAARPAASRREATSGAAARARTSSNGPSRSLCGRGWPMRAAKVPMVVSVTKGTTPVTASYRTSASE